MYKAIVSIVPQNIGDAITAAARNAGAGGGTIIRGKGTSESGFLHLLGIGDTSKEITLNIVPEERSEAVCQAIIKATEGKKPRLGILFKMNVGSFMKSGEEKNTGATDKNGGDRNMNDSYQVIHVIVNKGYAEDVMAAARKAGAGGGTILSARGTAKEGDAKFFGVEIVPEKDMLIILVPSEKKASIMNEVKRLPCLQKSGAGIVYCTEAEDFTILGKKE